MDFLLAEKCFPIAVFIGLGVMLFASMFMKMDMMMSLIAGVAVGAGLFFFAKQRKAKADA